MLKGCVAGTQAPTGMPVGASSATSIQCSHQLPGAICPK